MRRLVSLAIAAAAVAALAVIPVPTAYAVAANTCNGVKTNITGSGKAEKFFINSTKRVINAHGGNDVISGDYSLFTSPATVCMGSGDDILKPVGGADAVAVQYLDGGAGFDTAEIYVCFEHQPGPKVEVRSIEKLTIVNCQD